MGRVGQAKCNSEVNVTPPGNSREEYFLFFQSLHHQFIASAKTIKIARELSPKSQSGCMVACFCYYPLTSSPEDNLKAVRDEEIHQWFAVDILANGHYPSYMDRFVL